MDKRTRALVWAAGGIAGGVVGGWAGTAGAQTRLLLVDRTADCVWLLHDANNDGSIDLSTEVSLFFGAGNADGLGTCLNPNTIGAGPLGSGGATGGENGAGVRLVLVGDQDASRRCVFALRDRNGDGDAMDAGEAVIGAASAAPGEAIPAFGTPNASGVSFAFPTGVAFDAQGRACVTNAGNAFGADAIWRLIDGDADGAFGSAGEITPVVGDATTGFGPGNGPFSPQEIVFAGPAGGGGGVGGVGYMRESGTANQGVWRLQDLNNNGRADDPGEFTLFFGAGNGSGVTVSAGFAVDVDPTRPGAVYMLQTATGGVDQLYRLRDGNGDGDAMDAGEAELVFSTAEAGFTSIDAMALADGSVLISENGGDATKNGSIIRLRDIDGDGRFASTGERSTWLLAAVSGRIRAVRAMSLYPVPPALPTRCNLADVTGIGGPPASPDGLLTGDDFNAFIAAFASGGSLADVTGIGGPPAAPDGLITGDDFNAFIAAFAAGCP